MKLATALLTAVVLVGCSQPPSGAETPAAPNADATSAADAAPPPMAAGPSQMATETAAAGTPASASGTVEAIDAASGKITLAHGAVAALNWPPMTMAFKATPDQVASVQVGQKVDFEFVAQGMEATITRIGVQAAQP